MCSIFVYLFNLCLFLGPHTQKFGIFSRFIQFYLINKLADLSLKLLIDDLENYGLKSNFTLNFMDFDFEALH